MEIITSVNTIYFWQNTEKGMSEIYRVLKPGGVFYNSVYSKSFLKKSPFTRNIFKFFTKKDYIAIGKRAGFTENGIKARHLTGEKLLLIMRNTGIFIQKSFARGLQNFLLV